jgi:hypothetical protein
MQTAKLLFQLFVGRGGHGYLVGDAQGSGALSFGR